MGYATKLLLSFGLAKNSLSGLAFAPTRIRYNFISTSMNGGSTSSALGALPTIQELSNDSFMKQVSHADHMVDLLAEQESSGAVKEEDLEKMLMAQLSHSDGIRGFFVTYLTGETSPADQPEVPKLLVNAMKQVDPGELVPLACMNVVMPTAMITMHQDASLSEQSRKTAERGLRVLQSLKEEPLTRDNCKAILSTAISNSGDHDTIHDQSLLKYWEEFFEKWGYQDQQKEDIAKMMKEVV